MCGDVPFVEVIPRWHNGPGWLRDNHDDIRLGPGASIFQEDWGPTCEARCVAYRQTSRPQGRSTVLGEGAPGRTPLCPHLCFIVCLLCIVSTNMLRNNEVHCIRRTYHLQFLTDLPIYCHFLQLHMGRKCADRAYNWHSAGSHFQC